MHNLRRAGDGRYVVRLPFELDARKLGESREIALQRFKGMERKLLKDATLKAEYVKFMREYEHLGHMKEVSHIDLQQPHYFVPHHAVLKPESTTTKLRVVFDASAKTSTNLSLNDILAKGPIIQDDVATILTRFRFPRYVFTADVEKMYRQIWVDEQDQIMQLIWWREDPEKPLKRYQLKTVTYGTTSAPYLAIRTLQALADERASQFPLAANAIKSNFYVDDVLCGSDSMAVAIETQRQLRALLQSAGFNLRKWCANHTQLLQNIPKQDQEIELTFNESSPAHIKTMGLIWHPGQDSFKIKIGKFDNERITKRTILSDSAHIFDPLGFVAPVTAMAKIMLQKLWLLKLDWDAAIPQDMELTWSKFRKELQLLQTISFPRHIFGHKTAARPQLHIFADASEAAYGAVAYMRITEPHNVVIIRFLCAKSRVAPVKQISLARLELCAAKLAAELFQKLQESNCFKDVEPYFWSDSTVTLGWIYAESRNYHTFIANRIATVQRLTTQQQWRYVPSQENPADLLSRGLTPAKMVENNLWMCGPTFLHGSVSCWPLQPPRGVCTLEMRKPTVTTVVTTTVSDEILHRIDHRNNFRRCQRIVAYVLRVKSFKRGRPMTLNIQANEAEEALRVMVKIMQKSAFAEEMTQLKRHGTLNNSSPISSLTPFLDEDDILRVGGRLESAELKFDSKHPMLLPYPHQLTKLLIETLHRENLHAGPQTLMSIVRERFWPLKLKMAARSIVQQCVQCTRAKPKLLQQLMGNLPADRVQPSRPFIKSGVDFFGPVWTHYKIRGKRPTKAYVAVFCCFSTKAIHMELVSDLTTEAFIGAVKRFIARRGRCEKLYCDNATNFVGARNQIAELQHIIQDDTAKEKITNECNKKGLEFKFIPPRAPHFGGLWEAGVKSAKGLLQGVLTSASLTYEEMETVIVEAEAILNSRPMTQLSSNPNDLQALTPGHLLIGEPLTSTVDSRAQANEASYPTRWKLITHLKAEFWKRWQNEYLSSLQHRYKWKTKCQNAQPGMMVVIKDDNLPPLKWQLGRITRVIHGDDGLVRVADVRTATGVSRRPIHKLAPLPINDQEEELVTRSTTNGKKNTGGNQQPVIPSKRQRTQCASTLTTLLLVCLCLPICLASLIEVQPFDTNPGIFYERLGSTGLITSEWSLVTYVDMQSFWKKFAVIETYPKALRSTCIKAASSANCHGIMTLIENLVEELRIKNQILEAHKGTRTKRGAFNIVGNIGNSLFGILDSQYALEAEKTIERIRENEQYLVEELRNQTSYVDSTMNIMKRNQQTIQQEVLQLEKSVHRLQNERSNEVAMQTIAEGALHATLEIWHLQRIQDSLIDILVDTHHGKISPELMSPQQLHSELTNIKANLPTELKLPAATEELLNFYKLMTVEGRATEGYIIFKIKIPLQSSEPFELLKLVTVPWQRSDKFYKLQSEVTMLIINLHRDKYLPLRDTESHTCRLINTESYLCHQNHPVYKIGSTVGACESQLLSHNAANSTCTIKQTGDGPHWIQLSSPNNWIFSVGENYTINAVCGTLPSKLTLRHAGILRLQGDCTIKQPMVTIQGYHEYSTIVHKSYIPSVNISSVLEQQHSGLMNQSSARTLEDLNLGMSNLRIELPNKLRPHDIHHYVISYMTLLGLLAMAAGVYWMLKTNSKNNSSTLAASNITDIEEPIITVYGCANRCNAGENV